MSNHCDTCEYLLSEETSKAVGTEYNCTFNPIWLEIIGPAAHFCGRWVEHPRIHQERQQKEAEAQMRRWEIEHETRIQREKAREEHKRTLERDAKVAECLPAKLIVSEPILPDQSTLSLREKMKRRFGV